MTRFPFRVALSATACALVLVAGCGGDDLQAGSTTTTEAATQEVTVHLVADIVGLGCTATAPVGNGSQMVVLGPDGTRLGVGTFELSPGLTPGEDTCDWTATADGIPADFDVYVIEGDGVELATVDLEQSGWTVELRGALNGVKVEG